MKCGFKMKLGNINGWDGDRKWKRNEKHEILKDVNVKSVSDNFCLRDCSQVYVTKYLNSTCIPF